MHCVSRAQSRTFGVATKIFRHPKESNDPIALWTVGQLLCKSEGGGTKIRWTLFLKLYNGVEAIPHARAVSVLDNTQPAGKQTMSRAPNLAGVRVAGHYSFGILFDKLFPAPIKTHPVMTEHKE